MSNITDFKAWLDELDLGEKDYEEIYSLHCMVREEDNTFGYECSRSKDGKQLIIKSSNVEDTLVLTDKSKLAFLNYIEEKYCDDDMDMDSWYGYNRAMAKED